VTEFMGEKASLKVPRGIGIDYAQENCIGVPCTMERAIELYHISGKLQLQHGLQRVV